MLTAFLWIEKLPKKWGGEEGGRGAPIKKTIVFLRPRAENWEKTEILIHFVEIGRALVTLVRNQFGRYTRESDNECGGFPVRGCRIITFSNSDEKTSKEPPGTAETREKVIYFYLFRRVFRDSHFFRFAILALRGRFSALSIEENLISEC